jgi:hypothetical protein
VARWLVEDQRGDDTLGFHTLIHFFKATESCIPVCLLRWCALSHVLPVQLCLERVRTGLTLHTRLEHMAVIVGHGKHVQKRESHSF